MSFFLDTNIISYYLAADAKVKEKVVETIYKDGGISTTQINVYEILRGLRWRNNKRKEELFKNLLKDVYVFMLDDKAIDIASSIYADLRKSGKTIEDTDVLIAAITIRNDGILVSNNTKHYEGIEQLKLINWV